MKSNENTRLPLFVANWKMNKLQAEVPDYVGRFNAGLRAVTHDLGKKLEVVLCPATCHLSALTRELEGKHIDVGAQNCGNARFGAFTGEVSPVMLKDLGVRWTLAGHSERRHVFGETDAMVVSRTRAALEEGLRVIFCVGETLDERRRGSTVDVVRRQLAALAEVLPAGGWQPVTVAYEPVWAIGTGETATPAQAQEVHHFVRGWAEKSIGGDAASRLRILYGGSVKPENSAQLMVQPDVDGLLVGSASLDPAVFAGVVTKGFESGE